MATLPDLRDLDHFQQEVNAAAFTLPVGGKTYTWSAGALSIRAGLRIQQARAALDRIAAKIAAGEQVDPAAELLPGVDEEEFALDLIGADRIDEMSADGVKWTELQFVGTVLFAWHVSGRQAAEDMWLGKMGGPADPPAESVSTTTGGSSARTTKRKPPAGSAGGRSSRAGSSSRPVSKRTTTST